eukprot:7968150-Ditylum_brightwellii.AAC.1
MANIGTLTPMQEQPLCCTTSVQSTLSLEESVLQVHHFNLQDHGKCMNGESEGGKKNKTQKYKDVLEQVTLSLSLGIACSIKQAQESSKWLNILLWHCNNTVLDQQKI